MEIIIFSVLTITLISFIFGFGLAFADKKLSVKSDPKLKLVEEVLPQVNCGACGYPGCAGYAKAIVENNASITLCTPGGEKVVKAIAEIMGQQVSLTEKKVARIMCGGSEAVSKIKFLYKGILDCNQAVKMFDGNKECIYGCIGLGSCYRACNFDAIYINQNKKVKINEEKCTGCGLCVDVCPKNIIQLFPANSQLYVSCKSQDKGAVVRKICKVGCIACKLCEKACKYDAVHVINFVAYIDPIKCTACNECFKVCKPGCIISYVNEAKSKVIAS